MHKITRYNRLQRIAHLKYSDNLTNRHFKTDNKEYYPH